MKILITGGLGFVGTNLISALNEQTGYDVFVLDNESLGKEENIADLDATLIKGDICDAETVESAVSNVDAIVHLAADTRVLESIDDPVKNYRINVQGTMNILEAMRKHGKKRIVFASTGGAIVGEAEPPLHEQLVANPISPYGASKLAIEGYLSAYRGSYDFQPISFRFSNVYGPRSFHKGSVVAAFYKDLLNNRNMTIYGDGGQTRDFIYVGELCKTIIESFNHDISGVFQLGSGDETSLNQLIDTMQNATGIDMRGKVDYLDSRKGEIYRTYCDISKARNELDYNPHVELEAGLRFTWEWFNAQLEMEKKAA